MTIAPSFEHIAALTDRYGTFEHADHARPRREHGYCTDDAARVLVVATREPQPSRLVRDLAHGSLRFLADAQGVDGASRNRRTSTGRWRGRRGVEDCWGRSMWGFGTAASSNAERWLAADALAYFEHGCQQRSLWPRSMAFAALGAAAVLTVEPTHRRAAALLGDAADLLGVPGDDPNWPWPEPRLTYANAVLPEAMLAAGAALRRPALVGHGLDLLGWLLNRETRGGHLSVTAAGGGGPLDVGPRFDQQPIEVAAMADACTRARQLTGDPRWAAGVLMAAAWFDGDNDAETPMWDPITGGGYDGLQANGANQNQGAESSLALIATRQRALLLDLVAP
jgi:hypothetical protein